MALDCDLLTRVIQGQQRPLLRFYQWQPVTISLGYHQRHYPDAWRDLTWQGQPIPLVRRPTGGRAVLHQGDLCYSLILPAHTTKRRRMYEYCCEFLVQGWRSLGIPLTYGTGKRGYIHHPSCFSTATAADLVMPTGQKLIGSAQLWREGVVLQQGSIVLNQDDALFADVFGEKQETVAIAYPISDIIQAMKTAAAEHFDIQFES